MINTEMTRSTGPDEPQVRILIADDHQVMRLGVRNLLEARQNWSICAEAADGREAVEKALQFRPDVIIMDIAMPVMNGLEAADRIAGCLPDIPVILFSLHWSDDLRGHFEIGGVRGAVRKGDAATDLVEAIEHVLGGGTFFPSRKSRPAIYQ